MSTSTKGNEICYRFLNGGRGQRPLPLGVVFLISGRAGRRDNPPEAFGFFPPFLRGISQENAVPSRDREGAVEAIGWAHPP